MEELKVGPDVEKEILDSIWFSRHAVWSVFFFLLKTGGLLRKLETNVHIFSWDLLSILCKYSKRFSHKCHNEIQESRIRCFPVIDVVTSLWPQKVYLVLIHVQSETTRQYMYLNPTNWLRYHLLMLTLRCLKSAALQVKKKRKKEFNRQVQSRVQNVISLNPHRHCHSFIIPQSGKS